MSDEDSSQERTEEPTEKRRSEARDKGQIPRSKELNTAFVVLVGMLMLLSFGVEVGEKLLAMMRSIFTIERDELFTTSSMLQDFYFAISHMLIAILPILIILVFASLIGAGLLGGIRVNFSIINFKLERLDPISGFKRMFSLKGLMELVKALGKFVVILLFATALLYIKHKHIMDLSKYALQPAVAEALHILGWTTLILSLSLFIIAAIDVPFQLWDNAKQLKMTRQELRDEYKEVEGRPEVKQKIRQLQEEVSKRKMMADVPQADVIITNPTHYAVALKYDQLSDGAPIVIARGVDHMALHIIKVAQAHQVELFAAPPLARAIYHSTKLNAEIPYGLYIAVAQVLAYVFQIRMYKAGKAKKPKTVKDLPIPDDLKR